MESLQQIWEEICFKITSNELGVLKSGELLLVKPFFGNYEIIIYYGTDENFQVARNNIRLLWSLFSEELKVNFTEIKLILLSPNLRTEPQDFYFLDCIYRNHKTKDPCKLLHWSQSEDTKAIYAVYQDVISGYIFHCPLSEFINTVDGEPRFKLVQL